MKTTLLALLLICLGSTHGIAQKQNFSFTAHVEVSKKISETFKNDGRLYLFLSKNANAEPRTQTWPSPVNKTYIFAKNMSNVNPNEALILKHDSEWISTIDWNLDNVPSGEYYVQVLWDQDQSESRIDAPGNLYSDIKKVNINQSMKLDIVLNESVKPRAIKDYKWAKLVDMKSDLLSNWWKKPMHLKAAVLLPHNFDKNKAYPIRYNVAGYGGRYTRINRLLNNQEFIQWWESDEAPEIVTVFLDGEGPFGDSYQLNSDNSGPYGDALIDELIPHIESQYRGTSTSTTRFVDGCSTGGWVSLGLQLYYPDTFNGAFSYSPDAIEFENYQLVNIYKDKNAFVNEFGYERPVMRNTAGEPMLSLREFIQYENVLGSSNTYVNSGGQFSAHTALYSPKGENGLPKPLVDPKTGIIDPTVAEHWKKYDFKLYAQENWKELGPKIQGKIFIWMGDMDHFYLNPATRAFSDFIDGTTNPKSDAEIVFSAMEGHCSKYSDFDVFMKIKQRLEDLKK